MRALTLEDVLRVLNQQSTQVIDTSTTEITNLLATTPRQLLLHPVWKTSGAAGGSAATLGLATPPYHYGSAYYGFATWN